MRHPEYDEQDKWLKIIIEGESNFTKQDAIAAYERVAELMLALTKELQTISHYFSIEKGGE